MEPLPIKELSNISIVNRIRFKNYNLWYGEKHVLKNINLTIKNNLVTAFMGPSGCGKSTLLRSIDRMNDMIPSCRTDGEIFFDDMNIFSQGVDPFEIRKKIGMVFQKPNPFPMSIYENVAYGPKRHKTVKVRELDALVERSLMKASLWDEVKDRLRDHAFSLSGGQQQRLCIARALSLNPEVLLMDEPCSALDPIATRKIEDLMRDLKQDYTVILVTHNLQQAARVSDMTGFMYLGELIEFENTKDVFSTPNNELTKNYISGRFG